MPITSSFHDLAHLDRAQPFDGRSSGDRSASGPSAWGKASLRLRLRRWLRCDGLHQIRPRALFEPRVQGRRRVELSTSEKPLQDGHALARVDIRRNPGVLGANLALVLGKTRRCRTQDGEVDIDQKRGVGRRRRCRVAGRHDEVVDAPASVRIEACRIERLHGPLRRARLVIVGMHVIYGVVDHSASSISHGRSAPARSSSNSARHSLRCWSVW